MNSHRPVKGEEEGRETGTKTNVSLRPIPIDLDRSGINVKKRLNHSYVDLGQ